MERTQRPARNPEQRRHSQKVLAAGAREKTGWHPVPARERDGLRWVEHSWLGAEVWAALKSTLAALGGGQQGLHLEGEAQGRIGLLRGLKGARI